MAEVKFLSKTGLDTLVENINGKFVTQADFNAFKNQFTENPDGDGVTINPIEYYPGENIQISDNVISAIDTKYEVFNNESDGLVPKPESENENLFLCADGTWKTIDIDSTNSNNESSGLTTTGTLEYFNSDNETGDTAISNEDVERWKNKAKQYINK